MHFTACGRGLAMLCLDQRQAQMCTGLHALGKCCAGAAVATSLQFQHEAGVEGINIQQQSHTAHGYSTGSCLTTAFCSTAVWDAGFATSGSVTGQTTTCSC